MNELYLISVLTNIRFIISVILFVIIPLGLTIYFMIHGDSRDCYALQRRAYHNKMIKRTIYFSIVLLIIAIFIPDELTLYQLFDLMEFYEHHKN